MAEIEYLTIEQVAQLFGINSRTIRDWVRQRRFPAPTQVGKSKFWSRTKVLAWMNALDMIEQVTGKPLFLDDEIGKIRENPGKSGSLDAEDDLPGSQSRKRG